MELDKIEKVSESRMVEGIRLPYELKRRRVYGDPSTEEVYESGEVFIEYETLENLSEQRRWDSQSGRTFLLDPHEGAALEAAGLAVRETRGGYHRPDGPELADLLKRLWYG